MTGKVKWRITPTNLWSLRHVESLLKVTRPEDQHVFAMLYVMLHKVFCSPDMTTLRRSECSGAHNSGWNELTRYRESHQITRTIITDINRVSVFGCFDFYGMAEGIHEVHTGTTVFILRWIVKYIRSAADVYRENISENAQAKPKGRYAFRQRIIQ